MGRPVFPVTDTIGLEGLTLGGGRLELHGSLAASRVLVIVSRDNFQLDDEIVNRLVRAFARSDLAVVRYESRLAVTTRLIDRPCFHGWPIRVRQALKSVLLLFHPLHWRHFSSGYRARQDAIPYRVRALDEVLDFIGREKEIVMITRSAGGRIASLLADRRRISRLVCLGYPFQHPVRGPEPARVSHLEHLRTPFLIIQGRHDSYGGPEVEGKYRFNPNTTIEWVDATHDFSLPPSEWQRVVRLIENFIAPAPLPAGS